MSASTKEKCVSQLVTEPMKAPPGFATGPTLTPQLIIKLKQFIESEECHTWFEKDKSISRSTINYGWNYVDMENDQYHFIEIPSIIQEVRQKIVKGFSDEIANSQSPEDFDNIIITIYEPGQYLIAHYDADNSKNPLTKRNFHFEEPILGLVVEADPTSGFTFYHHEDEGRPALTSKPTFQVSEKDGATFLIQGASRYAPYFHGIPPTKNRRISITMRRTVLPQKVKVS